MFGVVSTISEAHTKNSADEKYLLGTLTISKLENLFMQLVYI